MGRGLWPPSLSCHSNYCYGYLRENLPGLFTLENVILSPKKYQTHKWNGVHIVFSVFKTPKRHWKLLYFNTISSFWPFKHRYCERSEFALREARDWNSLGLDSLKWIPNLLKLETNRKNFDHFFSSYFFAITLSKLNCSIVASKSLIDQKIGLWFFWPIIEQFTLCKI